MITFSIYTKRSTLYEARRPKVVEMNGWTDRSNVSEESARTAVPSAAE